MSDNITNATNNTEDGFDNRLALFYELYEKKHAELLAQLQQSENINLQNFIQQYNQKNLSLFINNNASLVTSVNSSTKENNANLNKTQHASNEHLNEDNEMQTSSNSSPLSTKETVFSIKNKKTSGFGQTISQATRDRLKTMIASKKQKQKLQDSCSAISTSTSNIILAAITAAASNSKPWVNVSDSGTNNLIRSVIKNNRQFAVSTPHFEPYPHPSPVTNSEFQLRKTNSEPNLKMRLRQRLLSKGSSPVTHHQPNSINTSNHLLLQRCNSDSAPLEILKSTNKQPSSVSAAPDRLQETNFISNLQFPFSSNAIIPSPSLPNLYNSIDCSQLDYANLIMQPSFNSFLSLPSLLKNPLFQSTSMFEPIANLNSNFGTNKSNINFNNRSALNSLFVGGYPSLLKQQLRDLVLRRKSLVREEPEDESAMLEASVQRWQNNFNENQVQNTQLKTGLAYDGAMSKHQCLCGKNENHVEHGGRVQSIWAKLVESGLTNLCERLCVKKASLELLKLAHSSTYVKFFAVSPTACMKIDLADLPLKSFVQLGCGGIGVDSDTYFNDANTQTAIRVAVGLLVELASQVAEGKLKNGFACIRPPGHHAEREQAMGFCFFNNISITARHLQQKFSEKCKSIAIIDWDVHHGNGTQLCFERDSSILYISIHRHDNGNFFPGTGAVTEIGVGEGKGYTVNIPFSGEAMGDAEYLAAWRVIVLPVLESFKPNIILVSSGFDAAKGHSPALGGYEISPQLFGYFTRTLMSFADGKVVLALEGGYDLPSICECAKECVKALCSNGGDISNLNIDVLNKIPNQSAQETIQKVIAVYKKHWPCLTGIQGINTSELHWQTISHRFSTLTLHS